MNSLPNLLCKMVEFLQKQSLILSKNSRDGRINSAFNEDEIFNLLHAHFDINRPNMRDWFDFSFEENENFYPVNIKITNLSTDNLNCKLGIYYALTGKLPHFDNEIRWANFFSTIKENLAENSQDYYFLIINKNDTKDIFATSLKYLNELTPNGNNLPFQANWAKNRILVHRDFFTSQSLYFRHYGAVFCIIRARAYDEFVSNFPEFKVN